MKSKKEVFDKIEKFMENIPMDKEHHCKFIGMLNGLWDNGRCYGQYEGFNAGFMKGKDARGKALEEVYIKGYNAGANMTKKMLEKEKVDENNSGV